MMYVVNFQLRGGAESEYAALYTALQGLGPWSDRLRPAWVVESSLSSSQIRDVLKPHVKDTDRIFVAEFTRNWAATGMGAGFAEWMKKRVSIRAGRTAADVEREKALARPG